MIGRLSIDGVVYDIPDQDDWELEELAEFNRLRDKWGDIGGTIAVVWIVKHRENRAFTIDMAQAIKGSKIEEEEVPEQGDPLPSSLSPASDGSPTSNGNKAEPSVTPVGSGIQ